MYKFYIFSSLLIFAYQPVYANNKVNNTGKIIEDCLNKTNIKGEKKEIETRINKCLEKSGFSIKFLPSKSGKIIIIVN